MIRSLFSGVTGMKNHQIRMDVIGNNIANINTVGFKRGQVNFQDTLYQVLKSAGASTNPIQVGLGVAVSSIINNMNPGALQLTGRTLDLAINGDGFFKVRDPMSKNEYYTRDGVFYIDQDGYIVNADGYRLMGTLRNITAARSKEEYTKVSVDELQVTDELVGTGDGQKTIFNHDLSNVVDGSLKVFVDGKQVTDCNVDLANGTITFNTAPIGDVTVSYQKAYTSLTLRGTKTDGTTGESKIFTICAARMASINAGESYKIAA
ncbi:MAG: flagellar hook-basal body complex protein, partial [Firmicutes bacterium]|nr:flagellar hook-basal body complex protein [Bacillota bacterium]